jgi:hypothetical protein
LNTTRNYAAKQREWRAWCSTPRIGPDGLLSTWPDGEHVTPDKLVAWLKEEEGGEFAFPVGLAFVFRFPATHPHLESLRGRLLGGADRAHDSL